MNTKLQNILVIGSGAWGTTLARILSESAKEVFLYARNKKVVQDISVNRRNSAYLPNISLPDNILPTNDLRIDGIELIVMATPVNTLTEIFQLLKSHTSNNLNFLLCSKGVDCRSLQLPSNICREFFRDANIALMSGPNLAKEIAQEKIAKTLIATENIFFARQLQKIFTTKYFYPEISQDTISVELCGAYKNVLAIAVGIIKGLSFGENFLASFFVQALEEMKALIIRFEGNIDVVYSLAGIGDLLLTSCSLVSRNTNFGYRIALGTTREQEGITVEGYHTTKAIRELALIHKIDLPICNYVYNVLYKKGTLLDLINLLK